MSDAKRFLLLLLAHVCFLSQNLFSQSATGLVWNLAEDFSVEQGNPNGPWSYGYMNASFGGFALHTTGDYCGAENGPIWYTTRADSPPYGSVWKNTSGRVIEGVSPNQVSIHPCMDGSPGAIRWVAPAGVLGHASVTGSFGAGNRGIMRVAVFFKGAQFWSAVDSGSFSFETNVVPGDIVDFCVYGGYSYGATPCDATINVMIPCITTATLDPSGGVVSSTSMTVTNTLPYGLLPAPVRIGYTFGGWWTEPAGGGSQVTEATLVTATSNHTLYALWVGTITATAGIGGHISPAGDVTVPYGGTAVFTIQPDNEYLISDVLANGVSVGAVSAYSFTNVTSNQTVQATFSPVQRGTFRFQKSVYGVAESAGIVKLTVERVGGTYGEALVDVVASGETATADIDFVGGTTSLRWAAGQSGAKTVLVEILDDTICEGNETFCAALANATGAAIGAPSAAAISIEDDEDAPTRIPRLSGSLDFGNVATNSSVWKTVTVWNDGNQELTVTNVTAPVGFFVTQQVFSVLSGEAVPLSVCFAPSFVAAYNGQLTLDCNATSGTASMAVSGTGVLPQPSPAIRRITGLTAVITIDVPTNATALGVEDGLAPEMIPVEISDGGSWDAANHKVKWFFNSLGQVRDRSLQYRVGSAGSVVTGLVNFGQGNLFVTGDTVFVAGGDPGLLHPADDDGDWRITLSEASASVDRWRSGLESVRTPIVVRGIMLYLKGELYAYDPLVSAEAQRWVPAAGVSSSEVLSLCPAPLSTQSGAVREVQGTNVTVFVTPSSGTSAWGLEECVPVGVQVTSVSDAGLWSPASRTVRWAFFDGAGRTLSYSTSGPAGTNVAVTGCVSFDGSSDSVTGTSIVAVPMTFDAWATQRALSGDRGSLLYATHQQYGIPNGLVYAFQSNLRPGDEVIKIVWANGQLFVDLPAQDPSTAAFVDVFPVFSTDLAGADWTSALTPAADQSDVQKGRCRWVPVSTPSRAFFKVRAVLK